MNCAVLQLSKRWLMVSSSDRHIGHAFTTSILLSRRLSIVRIPPSRVDHPNAMTLGGAFILHRLAMCGCDVIASLVMAEKNDATENMPFVEAVQIRFIFPIFWNKNITNKQHHSLESSRRLIQISSKPWPPHCSFINPFQVIINFGSLISGTIE